jgi:glutathionylspermidine amidase/synthetase
MVDNKIVPFGEMLGKDIFGIAAFSCHTNDPNKIRNDKSFIFRNVFTGIKWECVEYIRRWLIIKHSITFQELDTAFNIFDLPYIKFSNLISGEILSYIKYYNGSIGNLLPKIGSIIIWDKFGEHPYGHCAIVVKLDKNYIYIAEQNWDNKKWNNTYSRKIPYSLGVLNSVLLIDKNIFNVSILGWISIDNLDRHIFYPQLNSRFNI